MHEYLYTYPKANELKCRDKLGCNKYYLADTTRCQCSPVFYFKQHNKFK